MLRKNLANILTVLRIIGTGFLIFLTPPPGDATAFLIVHGACGVTDALDGIVARTLRIESRFGSRLDSASDLFFYIVMMVRILPRLVEVLPEPFWYGVALVLVLRAIDYGYTAIRFRKFAAMHTILNKLTGFLIFCVPFVMELGQAFTIYSYTTLAVSYVAWGQEFIAHLRMKPEESSQA